MPLRMQVLEHALVCNELLIDGAEWTGGDGVFGGEDGVGEGEAEFEQMDYGCLPGGNFGVQVEKDAGTVVCGVRNARSVQCACDVR